MSQQPEEIRAKTDRLDAIGNTTKALTKGYAVGSAALAAFLLFGAYIDEVKNYKPDFEGIINLNKPEVFIGGLVGAVLVYLFSSLAIKAVGKAAYSIINNVREQFKKDPGIMEGTSKPDYGQCVDIATKAALRKMVAPGLLVVGLTLALGLIFKLVYTFSPDQRLSASGPEVVGGYLMVATISGILMALFLNNGGGAWDNAKKFIETGMYGGKKSEPHKASVVGDTVGDPFKDTAGPSLHVLIKLLSTLTLFLAPLFI
jgi:K(+)-stimulated pyrophosphate-energized sodium pump